MVRSADRSRVWKPGSRDIASSIVGTAKNEFTRCASMTSSVPAASNPRTTTAHPPRSRVGFTVPLSPPMWNSGASARVRSSAVKSIPRPWLTAFQVMLPWVSTAPLGRPVVPEVYMTRQGSSRATGSSRWSSSAAASSSS
jgi:hypothetical protein